MLTRRGSANTVLPSVSLGGLVRSAVRGERGARSSQHRALGKWYPSSLCLQLPRCSEPTPR